MRNILNNAQYIGIDTNLFIYLLDSSSPFHDLSEKLFKTVAKKNIHIVTSVLTLTELLSFKTEESSLDKLEIEFLSMPSLTLEKVDLETAREAAKIRRKYKFRLADSVQIATALQAKVQTFITNDRRLKPFRELPITLLTELDK